MKIGLIEKILIALSVLVVLGSFAFALNARPQADSVAVLKTLGMTCRSCAGTIEKNLLAKPGVMEVTVLVDSGQVTATYDSGIIRPEEIVATVTEAGYKSAVVKNLPLENYHAKSGPKPSGQGGCGSGCCN